MAAFPGVFPHVSDIFLPGPHFLHTELDHMLLSILGIALDKARTPILFEELLREPVASEILHFEGKPSSSLPGSMPGVSRLLARLLGGIQLLAVVFVAHSLP